MPRHRTPGRRSHTQLREALERRARFEWSATTAGWSTDRRTRAPRRERAAERGDRHRRTRGRGVAVAHRRDGIDREAAQPRRGRAGRRAPVGRARPGRHAAAARPSSRSSPTEAWPWRFRASCRRRRGRGRGGSPRAAPAERPRDPPLHLDVRSVEPRMMCVMRIEVVEHGGELVRGRAVRARASSAQAHGPILVPGRAAGERAFGGRTVEPAALALADGSRRRTGLRATRGLGESPPHRPPRSSDGSVSSMRRTSDPACSSANRRFATAVGRFPDAASRSGSARSGRVPPPSASRRSRRAPVGPRPLEPGSHRGIRAQLRPALVRDVRIGEEDSSAIEYSPSTRNARPSRCRSIASSAAYPPVSRRSRCRPNCSAGRSRSSGSERRRTARGSRHRPARRTSTAVPAPLVRAVGTYDVPSPKYQRIAFDSASGRPSSSRSVGTRGPGFRSPSSSEAFGPVDHGHVGDVVVEPRPRPGGGAPCSGCRDRELARARTAAYARSTRGVPRPPATLTSARSGASCSVAWPARDRPRADGREQRDGDPDGMVVLFPPGVLDTKSGPQTAETATAIHIAQIASDAHSSVTSCT